MNSPPSSDTSHGHGSGNCFLSPKIVEAGRETVVGGKLMEGRELYDCCKLWRVKVELEEGRWAVGDCTGNADEFCTALHVSDSSIFCRSKSFVPCVHWEWWFQVTALSHLWRAWSACYANQTGTNWLRLNRYCSLLLTFRDTSFLSSTPWESLVCNST